GNPVGDQYVSTGGTTVQYFENARFELNREGSVGLGRIGAEAFHQTVPRVDDPKSPNVAYFATTGHTLQGAFKTFWEQNGGLSVFGYPISEVRDEDGTKVQYFERARFELVPSGNSAQSTVRLTPLGAQMWASVQQTVVAH
ncbi:MAG TPA: hypothetical protein VFU72_03375, partial [Nitrolancea sp.]|nr:hypothetical protein [Nitrolancea sp.]